MSNIDRALARLSKATARTPGDMATLYACADVLPLPIRSRLSNAVEELDLLQLMLSEATLAMATRQLCCAAAKRRQTRLPVDL
jgi:hypothetical protein